MPPEFPSLTQVCRQIRSEVLPQYRDCLSRTTVSLKASDIYDYIDAWIIPNDTKKEDIVGSLALDLGRSYDDNDWVILDIRPLLQLSQQARGLRLAINDLDDSRYVRQAPGHASIENTLVNMLAIVDTDKFYNYVETATTKLVWHDNRGAPALVFEMKPDCWEEWMTEKTHGDELDWTFSTEREIDTIKWARRCGLVFMEDDENDEDGLLCHPENVIFRREGQAEVQDGLRSRTHHRRARTKSPEIS